MKFTVLIHQHLVGATIIEAATQQDAIDKAHSLYNNGIKPLPDMDDCYSLQFEAIQDDGKMANYRNAGDKI